jgi:ABC-type phosphate transport system ATPase subunit
MNDLVRGFRLKGRIIFRGQDIYASRIDPVAVRRHIGTGTCQARCSLPLVDEAHTFSGIHIEGLKAPAS